MTFAGLNKKIIAQRQRLFLLVVVVVIVRFIVVTFERPAPCKDSTSEKLSPAFTIFHLGTASSSGLVQLNWTPLRV